MGSVRGGKREGPPFFYRLVPFFSPHANQGGIVAGRECPRPQGLAEIVP